MSDARVVKPNTIGESDLISSDVPETDYQEWDAGTTYALGAQVRVGVVAYESLTGSNTGSDPELGVATDPPTWLRLGYINRWRMFTEAKDSKTVQLEQIDATFEGGLIYDTLAVLGMIGNQLTVQISPSGGAVAWSDTTSLVDPSAADWWEYYFLPFQQVEDVVITDAPFIQDSEIRVLIESGDPAQDAAAGLVIIGKSAVLGETNYGTEVGLLNATVFERDAFGALRIIPRRTVNTAVYDITVPAESVDAVMKTLRDVGSGLALYVGDASKEATVIYGVPEEPRLNYTSPPFSSLSLEVQGK